MVLTRGQRVDHSWIIANLPPDARRRATPPISLAPLDNLLAAVGSQIFVLAAIFAVVSLIVAERERGTLAWVASKPVSRPAIWMAKWVVGDGRHRGRRGVVPLADHDRRRHRSCTALPAVVPVVAMAIGMVATIVLFVAVGLAASTVVDEPGGGRRDRVRRRCSCRRSSAALLPVDIAPFLPTSILAWTVGLASGAPVGVVDADRLAGRDRGRSPRSRSGGCERIELWPTRSGMRMPGRAPPGRASRDMTHPAGTLATLRSMEISRQTARRFVLGRQGLWPGRRWQGLRGTETAMRTMEHLQLDPLAIIARAQDLMLASRVMDYAVDDWAVLTYERRRFFEWGGWLAVRPMAELPHWRVRMRREREGRRWQASPQEHALGHRGDARGPAHAP